MFGRPARAAALAACALTAVTAPPALAAPADDPRAAGAKTRSVKLDLSTPESGGTLAVLADVRGRGARLSVARAPRGVAVVGGVRGGKLGALVLRPHGAAVGGPVVLKVTARGAAPRVRRVRTGENPAGTCAVSALFAKPVRTTTALGRAPLTAAGRALAGRLCGTAHDAALLRRLGLAPVDARPVGGVHSPGRPAASTPPPAAVAPAPPAGTRPPAPPAGGGTKQPDWPGVGGSQCENGMDDDGDGQTDFRDFQQRRPDPGCSGPGDTSEGSETAVAAACAGESGASRGEDAAELFVAINGGCGTWTEAWVNAVPAPASCGYVGADVQGVTCAKAGGGVALSGATATMADAIVKLGGAVDCSVPVTIALKRPDGSVAELVEPAGGCAGGGPPAAACANGKDDDGDGQVDAWAPSGRPDADPGCSGDTDTSEDSEVGLPAGCDVEVGDVPGRPVNEFHAIASGCGPLEGITLRPPGTAQSCDWHLPWASRSCLVSGGLASKALSRWSSSDAHLSATLAEAAPVCGRPVTVTLIRPDGQAPLEGRLDRYC